MIQTLFFWKIVVHRSPSVTGNFMVSSPTNASITLNYINGTGGSYPAFTSNTINGITLAAGAGTLTNSSGSIVFTASGTPVNAGSMSIPINIDNAVCNVSISVINATPPSPPGNCNDPGVTPGSTGCVTFFYRDQWVTYATVRGADGRIWLQQNIGSLQIATNRFDAASYGHYFQWGRWDDGHQQPTSSTLVGSTTLNNPSHIPSGNPNFIIGTSVSSNFWWFGGAIADTWSGTTVSSTNGKGPCNAIGQGWRMPLAAEWTNILNAEIIIDANSAFQSNLKLPEAGVRSSDDGTVFTNFANGHYWSGTAGNNFGAYTLYFDDVFNAFVGQTLRGYGLSCRCIKD